ncbi:MAG TPA: hypothetical protein PK402_11165, partial [Tepidisphaeraceae bacterium]|nr:hypothetical protein [Tepidisphaeraceae bacterium]
AQYDKAQELFTAAETPVAIDNWIDKWLQKARIDDADIVGLVNRGGEWDDLLLAKALIQYYKNPKNKDEFDPSEVPELEGWIELREARDAALDKLAKTESAYKQFIVDGDNAAATAQAAFEAEQKWIAEEKAKLTGDPRSPEYLQALLRIVEHANATYGKLIHDLQPYECIASARQMLSKLEARHLRVDSMIQKIRGRLGDKAPPLADGSDPTDGGFQPIDPNKPADPNNPNNQPLGDEYVCDQPVIRNGASTNVGNNDITVTVETPDGKSSQATIHFEGVPSRIRVGQQVTLTMRASGTPPAYSAGKFHTVNVVGQMVLNDNDCGTVPNFKQTGDPTAATITFIFGAGENPHIVVQGGQYNGDGAHTASITFNYRKVGG